MCYRGVYFWPKMVGKKTLFLSAEGKTITGRKSFYTPNLSAKKRVGPHNQDVISVLVGNLLGDGYAEKRKNSTRFHIHMSSKNAEYVFWLHRFFADRGYCSPTVPKAKKQIGKKNKPYFSLKFRTFSFQSLNWLYDLFYPERETGKGRKKCVPTNVKPLLTKRALSIWIMDDGGRGGDGLKISTESFSLHDNTVLREALSENFLITPTIQRHGDKHLLYFKKSDYKRVSLLVKPYVLPCMYYKLKL